MRKLLCKLGKHKFMLTKDKLHIKEYECSSCKQKYTENGYGQLVKLNSYWQKNNLLFEQYYKQNKAV